MIAILHINADKIQLRDNHRIRPGVSEHFHQHANTLSAA